MHGLCVCVCVCVFMCVCRAHGLLQADCCRESGWLGWQLALCLLLSKSNKASIIPWCVSISRLCVHGLYLTWTWGIMRDNACKSWLCWWKCAIIVHQLSLHAKWATDRDIEYWCFFMWVSPLLKATESLGQWWVDFTTPGHSDITSCFDPNSPPLSPIYIYIGYTGLQPSADHKL